MKRWVSMTSVGNQMVSSRLFCQSTAQQFRDSISQSQAIAFHFEANTIAQRIDSKYAYVADTWYSRDRDAHPGNSASRSAYTTQTFSPLVLDLHGSGITTKSRYYGQGVFFDVDVFAVSNCYKFSICFAYVVWITVLNDSQRLLRMRIFKGWQRD